jgi:2-enoate reductase
MHDLHIDIHMNSEVKAADIQKGGFDEVFIATGATERRLDIPGFESSNVTYAIDTLRNKNVEGENVLIVGGGLTGCEIAYELARKGKKVTIVEMTETILNAFGLSAANYNMMMELLDYYKVNVIKNAVVKSYENGVATVIETIKNYPNVANRAKLMFAVGPQGIPEKHEIKADHIVVSVGYTSNDALYRDVAAGNVHLIGDAKQPTNVMDAIWAAYETAMVI